MRSWSGSGSGIDGCFASSPFDDAGHSEGSSGAARCGSAGSDGVWVCSGDTVVAVEHATVSNVENMARRAIGARSIRHGRQHVNGGPTEMLAPHPREASPELAGRRVRFLTLLIWFEDGIPLEVSQTEASLVTLDDEGRRDQAEADCERHATAGLPRSERSALDLRGDLPRSAHLGSFGRTESFARDDIPRGASSCPGHERIPVHRVPRSGSREGSVSVSAGGSVLASGEGAIGRASPCTRTTSTATRTTTCAPGAPS